MTRKIALAAFAATLAIAPMMISTAEAKDNSRRNAAAFGIAAGIGGFLLGSAIANAQPRYHVQQRYEAQPRHDGYGSHGYRTQHVGFSYNNEPECVRRPINRVDRFTGEIVTVGSKLICR